jgi:hypothetical protein
MVASGCSLQNKHFPGKETSRLYDPSSLVLPGKRVLHFMDLLVHHNRIVSANLVGSHPTVVKGATVLVRVSVESAVEATTSARECWKQKLVES